MINDFRCGLRDASNKWLYIWRWILHRCVDCGAKIENKHSRGEVCSICFDNFNGLTIEELIV